MKIIILIDWSDDQSQMPQKPGLLEGAAYRMEATRRSRRVMKSFEYWRRKQSCSYRLVLWHTHFLWRFMPPQEVPQGEPYPWDCRTNLFEKQLETIAKNFDANEPIFLADDSFVFTDDLDLESLVEQAMRPGSGVILANNAWILNPAIQRQFIGGIDLEHFEKDWTEADFCDWIDQTTWTFVKSYAETAPHEYAVLGKQNTELEDLYKATMFILRNGYV